MGNKAQICEKGIRLISVGGEGSNLWEGNRTHICEWGIRLKSVGGNFLTHTIAPLNFAPICAKDGGGNKTQIWRRGIKTQIWGGKFLRYTIFPSVKLLPTLMLGDLLLQLCQA